MKTMYSCWEDFKSQHPDIPVSERDKLMFLMGGAAACACVDDGADYREVMDECTHKLLAFTFSTPPNLTLN